MKVSMFLKSLLAINLFVLSSCTKLNSVKTASENYIPSGLTYQLPVKRFAIKSTFDVEKCTQNDEDSALVDAAITVSVAESLIGGEAYTLNYEELSTWTKITDTQFQLSEAGLLTGINASIADQSGAIISNSATAAINVSRAASMPPIPFPVSNSFKSSAAALDSFKVHSGAIFNASDFKRLMSVDMDLKALKGLDGIKIDKNRKDLINKLKEDLKNPCKKISKLLAEKKDLHDRLVAEKDNDKKRQRHIARLGDISVEIKSLTSLADTYSTLGLDADKKILLSRIQLLEKERDQSESYIKALGASATEELTRRLGEIKDSLQVTTYLDFTPSFDAMSVSIDVKESDLHRLVDDVFDASMIRLPTVNFSVKPITAISGIGNREPASDTVGIAYRIPVASEAKATYILNGRERVIFTASANVPQFGPIGSLSLKNEAFDDNILEVAFNPATGSPSRVFFKAKSKGESASAAARDVSGSYFQFQKDKQSDRVDAKKVALEIATSEVALGKAQSELALAQVEAEIQLLRDQQRLQAVRTGTATAAEVELEALKTQEALLMQRLNILKLENDIAEQRIRSELISIDQY
jgi:cation transport regulator ChaC